MKKILLLLLIMLNLYAKDTIYLLPQDGKQAENRMVNLFKNAHENIKIAIYAFTNKKFLKALKSAAKRGVKIQIVADYGYNKTSKFKSIVPQLRKLRNIKVKLLKGKSNGRYTGIMHIKLFIIDDIIVGFGSANYTYSAFHKNYEILDINDDWTFTKKFIPIFNKLWNKHKKY